MSDLNFLCKKNLTSQDLRQVKAEHIQLRKVIEDYIEGNATKQEFLAAKRRVNDLSFLINQAIKRMQKGHLRGVT